MKAIVGVFLIVGGIVFGVWMGLWWAFVGGIVDLINAVKADEIVALDIAISIAKISCAGFIGMISACVLIIPGAAMLPKNHWI